MVYYDEPSTGLDPASRRALWTTIGQAKPGRGMILTTHSMEEAAVLCDRIGVFVGGALVMVGPPKQLVQQYGGWYALSLTTRPGQAARTADLVAAALPAARRTYLLHGSQRFEVPTKGVTLSKVRGSCSYQIVHHGRLHSCLRWWESGVRRWTCWIGEFPTQRWRTCLSAFATEPFAMRNTKITIAANTNHGQHAAQHRRPLIERLNVVKP